TASSIIAGSSKFGPRRIVALESAPCTNPAAQVIGFPRSVTTRTRSARDIIPITNPAQPRYTTITVNKVDAPPQQQDQEATANQSNRPWFITATIPPHTATVPAP